MLLSPDTDASPGEREDIELLERALEKALQVRTGTGPSKKDSKTRSTYQRETHTAVVTRKDGMLASAACKVNQGTGQTSVSVAFNRKEHGMSASSSGFKIVASFIPGHCKIMIY